MGDGVGMDTVRRVVTRVVDGDVGRGATIHRPVDMAGLAPSYVMRRRVGSSHAKLQT